MYKNNLPNVQTYNNHIKITCTPINEFVHRLFCESEISKSLSLSKNFSGIDSFPKKVQKKSF